MKCCLGISNFLEEISSLFHSVVFLYFFALITEKTFLISPCYSLELCIQMDIAFLQKSRRLLISWLHSPSAVILEPRNIKSLTVSPIYSFLFYCFPLFLCIGNLRRLSYLSLLFFGTLHSVVYIFAFLLCFHFSSFLSYL